MSYHTFTDEQRKWLIEHRNSDTRTQDFNKKFNVERTDRSIRDMLRNFGYPHCRLQPVSKEEIEYLKEYYPNCRDIRALVKDYNEKFHKNYTQENIFDICRNRNRGIKRNRRSLRKDRQPIGYEMKCPHGIYVKIKDTDHSHDNWKEGFVLRSRLNYEKYHNVKLTKDDVILRLNNDIYDDRPENLIRVSKHESQTLSAHNWCHKGMITKAGLEIIRTQDLIKEFENK